MMRLQTFRFTAAQWSNGLTALLEFIALTALRLTSFSSLLPWRARTGLRAGHVMPEYVQQLIDPATGLLDDDRLTQRLADLRGRLPRWT